MSRLNIPIPVTFTNEQQADLFRTCVGYKSRIERIESENAKLRELVVRMRPICVEGKRCTFADRIYINSSMEELRIEVKDD